MPCRIEIKTISLPEYLLMTGKVVSMVVAPPAHIVARGTSSSFGLMLRMMFFSLLSLPIPMPT